MGRSRFDADGVLCSDAGIGNDVCHGRHLLGKVNRRTLLAYGADD